MIRKKTAVYFTKCMNKIKIFTYCFLLFASAMAQQTRIELGSAGSDSAKQALLEERRQEIEILTLEAQLEAQKRMLQDSVRLSKFFGYHFFTQQVSETVTGQNVFENSVLLSDCR